MKSISLQTLADWCGGTLLCGDGRRHVERISKDSRDIQSGDVYVALRGENFNGNDFVSEAAAQGAVSAIVDEDVVEPRGEFALITVPDGLAALQQLAVAVRKELSLKVVCVTGSSGKTSTKDFTAAVLETRFATHKTKGNLNNHIGVPLTILDAPATTEAAVWEIGMNHPGEIAPLAGLCQPVGAIITNIGVAHIAYMGSRENIAREKGSLLGSLPAEGFAILNGEDDFCEFLAKQTKARVVRVGLDQGDVHAREIVQESEAIHFVAVAGQESHPVRLQVCGVHMVHNALMALAAGRELGVPLGDACAALEGVQLTGGRLAFKRVGHLHFLDDSYNANPDSMVAALETLRALRRKGRKIAVLGKMGELGDHGSEGYRRVGEVAARTADLLITVGEDTEELTEMAIQSGQIQVIHVDHPIMAAHYLIAHASDDDVILVKGSRSARMEQVLEAVTFYINENLSA